MKDVAGLAPANHPLLNRASAALIIAPVRSGGTFLSHCLSNHPDMYWDRGEPLLKRSNWGPYSQTDRIRLLDVLTNQTGYLVSGCKVTYDQAFQPDVWEWIARRQPYILWLRRENLLRQAVSQVINRRVAAGELDRPQHSFERLEIEPVEIDPQDIVRYIVHFGRQDKGAGQRLREALPYVLALTYEAITGNEEATEIAPAEAQRICEFLGVEVLPMTTRMIRIHPGPLSAILSNWPEVRGAVRRSEYAYLLEHEQC
jgi:hypothetical protein